MFNPYPHVPAYPLVFPLFYGAALLFALAMARHLRVFAAARQPGPRASDQLLRRLWGVVRYAILQTKMFREPGPGMMHAGIFWGFVLLTVGTADIVTAGLVRAVVAWPLGGVLWTLVTGLQNVIAVVVLASIGWALVRRLVTRPARLTYNVDALVILGLIGGVVASELLAQVFEAARYGAIDGAVVANLLALPAGTLGPSLVEGAFVGLWWLHIGLVSLFLVYLPFSKHLHIATSFFNVFFRKLEPRGRLPLLDLEAAEPSFGIRTIADLSWKDLLDAFTCTECGRCQAACPAWNTGKPLNPKTFIMGLREMAVEAERGIDLIPNSPTVRAAFGLDDTRPDPEALARPIVDHAIPFDAVWDCVTCGACVEACPVLIEHVDKIVGLRRQLVLEETRFPGELTAAFRNLEGPGNPWGQPPTARLDWTGGLPFPVPTAAEVAAAGQLDSLEVLYWVGCAAAFDERNRRVARAVVTCLHAAGVSFAVLGQEESCTGDPARRMGNEYVFQLLAQANIETLQRYRAGERTIVTACPHCFNTLANEYPTLGGTFRVEHHAVYLARLVAEGRLRPAAPFRLAGAAGGDQRPATGDGRTTVTFHDPCYLARYNGVLAEPRAVLATIPGLAVVEMERHGRGTFCCGAGGGRMWMEEQRGRRINHERTRQALATGAGVVATACPFCMVMIKDGLADTAAGSGREPEAVPLDIAELLAGTLEPSLAAGAGVPPSAGAS
jgi:Fe-S oxidoreductase